ncbi:MAG: murE [Micavibrio sp.]|nr:murE [Micavibrio sp.]
MHLSALSNLYHGGPDPEISGVTQDSRKVQPGWLFAAIPGTKVHGNDYIEAAVRQGASVILAARGTKAAGVQVMESDNPRRDLALIAARFYQHQPKMVAAVTGTNGKTSTVHFAQQIWQSAGKMAVSLGTIGVQGAVNKPGSMTTPDAVALHAALAEMSRAGVTHLAMEASSHGLEQHRLDGVKIAAAGFTNLTHDHLDYHGTMDEYYRAKARLFDLLSDDGVAVLNADVPEFEMLKARCGEKRVVSYGVAGRDLRMVSRAPVAGGQKVTLEIFGKRHDLLIPLVGSYMAMNALCAYGLAQVDEPGVLEALQGAPGRLQAVGGHPAGAAVYVDYAHTPDALARVLEALRPHTRGRLICIFGCGGDRDPVKRPIMGRIAAEGADLAIITDDNPRSEKPEAIRASIRAGAGPDALEIGDRREAIANGVKQLKDGDVLVIAGKGHEQGQIFADHTDHFDDVEEATNFIKHLAKAP